MQGYFIGPCLKVSQKFETKSLSKLIYSITLKSNVKVMRIKEMITNLKKLLILKNNYCQYHRKCEENRMDNMNAQGGEGKGWVSPNLWLVLFSCKRGFEYIHTVYNSSVSIFLLIGCCDYFDFAFTILNLSKTCSL